MNPLLNLLPQSVRAWWAERVPRERAVLAYGALALLVLLAWGLFWAPAADGIARLERDNPVLRAQRADIEAMRDEIQRLRGDATRAAPPVLAADARRPALERALARAGWSGVEIAPDGGTQRLRVRWADTDYARWIPWMASVERELGARAVRVSVQALTESQLPGRVRAEVVFEWRDATASAPAPGAPRGV